MKDSSTKHFVDKAIELKGVNVTAKDFVPNMSNNDHEMCNADICNVHTNVTDYTLDQSQKPCSQTVGQQGNSLSSAVVYSGDTHDAEQSEKALNDNWPFPS